MVGPSFYRALEERNNFLFESKAVHLSVSYEIMYASLQIFNLDSSCKEARKYSKTKILVTQVELSKNALQKISKFPPVMEENHDL